jgi:L-aminopeptidase/D-esterase-like protein
VVIAMIKAATFGVIAGLVGCYRGLTVRGGSKGLGTAVNETVVLCFIALFAVNVGADHYRRPVRNGALTWRRLPHRVSRFPRAPSPSVATATPPARQLSEVGQIVWFALSAYRLVPFAVHRYRKEICCG